jgi:hypothetical protein
MWEQNLELIKATEHLFPYEDIEYCIDTFISKTDVVISDFRKDILRILKVSFEKKKLIQEPVPKYGIFTDPRDGRTYKTVKIGRQTWLAENLNYEAEGSKCYENDPDNCAKYSRLYNWETAMKACPKGWHLPTNKEWQTLINCVDGYSPDKVLPFLDKYRIFSANMSTFFQKKNIFFAPNV